MSTKLDWLGCVRVVRACDFFLSYRPSSATRLQWQQWLNYSGETNPTNPVRAYAFLSQYIYGRWSRKTCKYYVNICHVKKQWKNHCILLSIPTQTIIQHIRHTYIYWSAIRWCIFTFANTRYEGARCWRIYSHQPSKFFENIIQNSITYVSGRSARNRIEMKIMISKISEISAI